MKLTYDRLTEFSSAATKWLDRNRNESKLSLALKKINEQIKTIFQKENKPLMEKIDDLKIDSYKTYDTGEMKGCLIKDANGQFVQTPESLKHLSKQIVKANEEHVAKLKKKEFEIEPHIINEYPDLTPDIEIAFQDIVIKIKNNKLNNLINN